MNVEDTPSTLLKRTPGRHFGTMPASPVLCAAIRESNANGFNTTLASTWAAAEIAGLEIGDLDDSARAA